MEGFVFVPEPETRNTFVHFTKKRSGAVRRTVSAPTRGQSSTQPSKGDNAVVFEAVARNKAQISEMNEKLREVENTVPGFKNPTQTICTCI